jgi:hypothetical protein
MEQLWKRGRNRSQRLAPPEAKERLRRPDLPLLQRDRIYAPHTIQRAISGTLAPLAHRRGYRATYPQLSRTVARAQGVGVGVRSQPGCTEPAVAPVKLSPVASPSTRSRHELIRAVLAVAPEPGKYGRNFGHSRTQCAQPAHLESSDAPNNAWAGVRSNFGLAIRPNADRVARASRRGCLTVASEMSPTA